MKAGFLNLCGADAMRPNQRLLSSQVWGEGGGGGTWSKGLWQLGGLQMQQDPNKGRRAGGGWST